MIRAFLFDYDGVITEGVDVTMPARRLAKNAGVSFDESSEAVMSVWDGGSTGKLSLDECWEGIEKSLGKKIPDDQRDIWFEWKDLTPIPRMVELVKELRAKGYPVGLLSNVFQNTADLIRENGGYDGFDFVILSCEAGARKPNREIYEIAMQRLNSINADEVLFLDDRQHCIDGAKEFGLNALLVEDHDSAISRIRALLN